MLKHEVDIIEIRPFISNSMDAFIDVRIDFLVINGVKIMRRESGENWLAWPSVEKENKYFEIVSIDSRSLERQVKSEIIRQYREKTGAFNDTSGAVTPGQPLGFIEGDPMPNVF